MYVINLMKAYVSQEVFSKWNTTFIRYKNIPTWTNNLPKEYTLANTLFLKFYSVELQNQLDSKSCYKSKLPAEIHRIKNFASWNRVSKSIRNSIIKQTLSKCRRQEQLDNYDDTKNLYINLPYMGNAGE